MFRGIAPGDKVVVSGTSSNNGVFTVTANAYLDENGTGNPLDITVLETLVNESNTSGTIKGVPNCAITIGRTYATSRTISIKQVSGVQINNPNVPLISCTEHSESIEINTPNCLGNSGQAAQIAIESPNVTVRGGSVDAGSGNSAINGISIASTATGTKVLGAKVKGYLTGISNSGTSTTLRDVAMEKCTTGLSSTGAHLSKSGMRYTNCTTDETITWTELTIASGAITVGNSRYYIVDTEADAASDDLDTINGMVQGEVYTFRAADAARTVVFKDGTSNLRTAGDFSADNSQDRIMLMRDDSLVYEVARSDNGA
jgi:hypothetical protein